MIRGESLLSPRSFLREREAGIGPAPVEAMLLNVAPLPDFNDQGIARSTRPFLVGWGRLESRAGYFWGIMQRATGTV